MEIRSQTLRRTNVSTKEVWYICVCDFSKTRRTRKISICFVVLSYSGTFFHLMSNKPPLSFTLIAAFETLHLELSFRDFFLETLSSIGGEDIWYHYKWWETSIFRLIETNQKKIIYKTKVMKTQPWSITHTNSRSYSHSHSKPLNVWITGMGN